jgi:hypothetical protein
MGVRILEDKEQGYKCLYCSTTMWAFGGLFYEDENIEEFLEWLPKDARIYKDNELEAKISDWRNIKNDKKN